MQFTSSLLVATTAALSVSAYPAKSMMAASASEWTIETFTRTCNSDNTTCDISFTIDTGSKTPCSYSVNGSPATQQSYSGQVCGAYTISSGWSDQFGVDHAFTTLSVTDQTNIIYPAYTDQQLVNGGAVSPDQSYQPAALP